MQSIQNKKVSVSRLQSINSKGEMLNKLFILLISRISWCSRSVYRPMKAKVFDWAGKKKTLRINLRNAMIQCYNKMYYQSSHNAEWYEFLSAIKSLPNVVIFLFIFKLACKAIYFIAMFSWILQFWELPCSPLSPIQHSCTVGNINWK